MNDNKTTEPKLLCAFCYSSEHKLKRVVKREWSQDFLQYIPVCSKHSFEGKPVNDDFDKELERNN